jgi:hypothetical protein
MVVKTCRFLTVPNRSSEPPLRVSRARPRSRLVSCSFWPCPSRFRAPVSSRSVGAVGAEGDEEVVQALRDPVELDGDGGAVRPEPRPARQPGTAGVGGQQLDVAVAHERGSDDGRLGVGRHGIPAVELELHLDDLPPRGDLRDGADLDAEDPDVGAGEEADRTGELAGDGDLLLARPEGVGAGRQAHHGQGGHDLAEQADPGQADPGQADPGEGGHHCPPTGVVRFWM